MRPYQVLIGVTLIMLLATIAAIPVSFRIAQTSVDPDGIEMIGFILAGIFLVLTGIFAVAAAATWSYEREAELDDKLLHD